VSVRYITDCAKFECVFEGVLCDSGTRAGKIVEKIARMRKMTEFQILDQVVPDSTPLQQRSLFQVKIRVPYL
jgi:hypothetical protein